MYIVQQVYEQQVTIDLLDALLSHIFQWNVFEWVFDKVAVSQVYQERNAGKQNCIESHPS